MPLSTLRITGQHQWDMQGLRALVDPIIDWNFNAVDDDVARLRLYRYVYVYVRGLPILSLPIKAYKL